MGNLFRRFIALGLAVVAIAPAVAGGASPAAAATVIYVDDGPGNNGGISCPNPVSTIQAGVNAFPVTGNATVFVCPGTYTAGANIVGKPNVKLIAKGNVTVSVAGGYSGFLFLMEGTSNTLIQGFRIDGHGTLSPTTAAVAIGFYTSSSGSVLQNTISGWRHSDLTVAGPLHAAISVDHSGVVKIDHNTLYDFATQGIGVTSSSAPVISHNRLTFTSHAEFITNGIQLIDVPGGAVTSNFLTSDANIGGAAQQTAGVFLINASHVKVKSNNIIAILIGLLVSGSCGFSQQGDGNQLTGNKLTDAGNGIMLRADDLAACGASVSNNVVQNNTIYFYGLGDLGGQAGISLLANGTAPVVDNNALNKNVIAGYDTPVISTTGVTNTDTTPPNKTLPAPPPGF